MAVAAWPRCYDHVFRALGEVRGTDGFKWKANCPAHGGDGYSLSVCVGTQGRLLVKCHTAGCPASAVLDAVGLEIDDLFPDNKRSGCTPNNPQRKHAVRFIQAYDYRDEQGSLLSQAVRYEPKTFTQRRPNPAFDPKVKRGADNPEWLADMFQVRRVLYRLPDVLAAVKANPARWVFVVEGEKDCDEAWRAGITATTNPMGAEKWKGNGYEELLRGCNVAVIPDEDAIDPKKGYRVGLRHAEEVCVALSGVARCVKLVRLPLPPDEKKDFSDYWLGLPQAMDLNAKKRALADVLKAAPVFDPAAPRLAELDTPTLAAAWEARVNPAAPRDPAPAPAQPPAPAATTPAAERPAAAQEAAHAPPPPKPAQPPATAADAAGGTPGAVTHAQAAIDGPHREVAERAVEDARSLAVGMGRTFASPTEFVGLASYCWSDVVSNAADASRSGKQADKDAMRDAVRRLLAASVAYLSQTVSQ